MPRTSRDDEPDEWGDESDEWDDDAFEDEYGDPDERTVPCPYCREPLFEDAEYCSRCENYISRETSPAEERPIWVWICLILALGSALFWALF